MLIDVCSPLAGAPGPDFPVTALTRHDRDQIALDGRVGAIWEALDDDAPFSRRKFAMRYHLARTRTLFNLDTDAAYTQAFAAWARSIDAFCVHSDGSLHDPEGRLLLGRDQQEGDGAPPRSPLAMDRKNRTEDRLATKGLNTFVGLPMIDDETEVRLRAPAEVALRCFSLLAVAVRGEALNTGDALPVSQLRQRLPLAFKALTPWERRFMDAGGWFKPKLVSQDAVQAAWRYEALAVLLWALGEYESLPSYDSICDVPFVANKLVKVDGARLVAEAHLRPVGEILDALDEIYRLHWILVDARMNGRPPPEGVTPGVVMERHHALNWLTCYCDDDWDEVTTDT